MAGDCCKKNYSQTNIFPQTQRTEIGKLRMKERETAVSFTDMENFTEMCSKRGLQELQVVLESYFRSSEATCSDMKKYAVHIALILIFCVFGIHGSH